ncbi:hypothetical protein [Pseudoduganella albidiflava]|uniref:Uncharacterized protein n=1 Tax=Pseudoduganella albidiflava TaxID=321983 RepID=A0A411WZG0_9BURK|nr:hypothetical protein [Pseudoduganella albidiflava]QBI02117.1 hypothetical protein EYF70_15565 [Pseudoduganella albidiflava]GGY65693.1 hypothetical protein GCM10007387_55050 [Pseudoduganella albidiflava]
MTTLIDLFKRLSRALGLDTADSFPPGHVHARTRWNAAYFDIASDVKPDDIERRICEAIANTPLVFAHITNPTPRMQRALFGVLEQRLRLRHEREAAQLAALLIQAYRSPHIVEAMPGLKAAIAATVHDEAPARIRAVLEFMAQRDAPFDVIDMH